MICVYFLTGNSIRMNRELVFLINSYDKGLGVHGGESFRRADSLFVARALIQPKGSKLWVSDSDVYFAPKKGVSN